VVRVLNDASCGEGKGCRVARGRTTVVPVFRLTLPSTFYVYTTIALIRYPISG
jgi:hypothetical protein